MVMFWDTSAVVPLLIDEPRSGDLNSIIGIDSEGIIVWWGTIVEGNSAICRRLRQKQLDEVSASQCLSNLQELSNFWLEIMPDQSLREEALRIIMQHSIKASDAMQLAAAYIWADGYPSGKGFVCLDNRLREAARIEGFRVLPENL